ncbi:bifunctional UDP-N-acetylmuramoyl-tripeptide:D-alanyl-D-alanine ligase/alanine racemase [Sphingobacterium daejeonense]|uniref:bifunctional UDP-N-acetylmuramoyl-tripeptide:D-alanyl-D-alanine ligase/alanine racemase n=1 Tax=Sphingobacterium daejeonense TaxID=371142 RepID=UPI0021A31E61|nr:bifunctional UDP-N-acetylmuramoyl-tripeptide:D-alanyl-D-alanine ligase/alanine racemase [Sphingobacterium daejeonense]MCT1531396.1 bifunctional UDP-N-acetylmuramoyl-tripeptide:D-alanyl-D-alanine ligase/alanine racemase [Sphingobacterium daejeonense]
MYTIKFICEVLKVTAFKSNDLSSKISELVYDSRKVNNPEESLFFALKATRDGHDFIPDAYEKGIRSFVISNSIPFLNDKTDVNVILVSDVLEFMQTLVTYHRKQFNIPIIGITGSNGKSIVKAWLYQLLMPEKKVYQSPKSYNSQLGVALSLWNLGPQYDMAIIEAGISEPGEMEKLQQMIQPTIGIFTNIGVAHSQNFESKQEKLAEKIKLFKSVDALITGSDYLDKEMVNPEVRMVSWGKSDHDQVQLISEDRSGHTSKLKVRIGEVICICQVPFTDRASIENILSCIATMYYLGYDAETVVERIQGLKPLEMRLQLKKGINHSSIIDDSYSNDLASLKISLEFLNQQNQHSKKTLILSEMEGLAESEKLQQKLISLLNSSQLERFIWVGTDYDWLNNIDIETKTSFENTESLLSHFTELDFHNESILVKGARKFLFERVVQRLALRSHGTVLEINLNAISNNLMLYRSLIPKGVKLMAMVKAFSYGSGSFEVANLLQFSKVDYLTVAFADEGVELRNAGITLPIMVLSPDRDTFQTLLQHNLEPEIYSMSFLDEFTDFLKENDIHGFNIHLKLDTGMHRLGFFPAEIKTVIEKLKNQDQVHVQSFFTHLVASGDPNQDDFTLQQIKCYRTAAQELEEGLGYTFIKHVANTSAIVRWPEAHMDMVRLGIGLYGVDMDRNFSNLEQVSSLKTTVTQIKELPTGETVGYDRKGVLSKDSKIATVKIGYADGYSRRFGNSVGKMQINGQLVSTVGNICMDMCMLDITGQDVQVGDEVIVFPSLMESAQAIGTIPYELLVNISSRVKRVYYYE